VQRIRIFSAGKIDNQFAAECLFVWAIDVNCVNCTKANNDLSTMKTNQKVKNGPGAFKNQGRCGGL
jgi:hypothetical protein